VPVLSVYLHGASRVPEYRTTEPELVRKIADWARQRGAPATSARVLVMSNELGEVLRETGETAIVDELLSDEDCSMVLITYDLAA
jgi:hypothetical protein